VSLLERYAERRRRTVEAMRERGVDALVVTVGPEMPWLVGYEAMPLERITALVVRSDGTARKIKG
jgi:Xaa-Pro aminopeptidase